MRPAMTSLPVTALVATALGGLLIGVLARSATDAPPAVAVPVVATVTVSGFEVRPGPRARLEIAVDNRGTDEIVITGVRLSTPDGDRVRRAEQLIMPPGRTGWLSLELPLSCPGSGIGTGSGSGVGSGSATGSDAGSRAGPGALSLGDVEVAVDVTGPFAEPPASAGAPRAARASTTLIAIGTGSPPGGSTGGTSGATLCSAAAAFSGP